MSDLFGLFATHQAEVELKIDELVEQIENSYDDFVEVEFPSYFTEGDIRYIKYQVGQLTGTYIKEADEEDVWDSLF